MPTPTHSAVDGASWGVYTTPGSGSIQNLAYRNDDTLPRWQEKTNSSRRRKWIVRFSSFSLPHLVTCLAKILGVVGIIAVIAIGVGVGVSVSNHNKSGNNRSSSNGSKGSGSGSGSGSGNAPAQTNPNDPSTFIKDPRLKQSFYGIAYTPSGAIPPNCTSTLSMSSHHLFTFQPDSGLRHVGDVISDIQVRIDSFFLPRLSADI